jgi:ATP-dependent Zn protease
VFIDEIDAVGRVRTGGPGSHAEEMTLNALLTEMDGFVSTDVQRPVFVLAATNFGVDADSPVSPERLARVLDPALVRRFDRAILVDLPDRQGRALYLRKRLAGHKGAEVTPETIDRIAGQSTGMSISNLAHVLEAAARAAAKTDGRLTDALLEEAFEAVRHGEVKVWEPRTLERVARHEAGHTVMYWLSGWCPVYVTVVARGGHGGYMERSPDEAETSLKTRTDLLGAIRTSLGGRAAETVFYGKEEGLSSGASGDLQDATDLARTLICGFGMDEDFGLVALSLAEATEGPMAEKVHVAIGAMLRREMACTIESLSAHRAGVEAISRALIERNRLDGDEVRRILHDLCPCPMV